MVGDMKRYLILPVTFSLVLLCLLVNQHADTTGNTSLLK